MKKLFIGMGVFLVANIIITLGFVLDSDLIISGGVVIMLIGVGSVLVSEFVGKKKNGLRT